MRLTFNIKLSVFLFQFQLLVSQMAVYHGQITLHAVNWAAWKITLFWAPNKVTLNKDDTAARTRILSNSHLPVIYPGPGSSPSSLLSFPGAPFPSPISITWLFNPCDAIGQFVKNTFKPVCFVSSTHFLIWSFCSSFATGFLCSTPKFNFPCCAMDIQDWKLNYFLWSSVVSAVSYGLFPLFCLFVLFFFRTQANSQVIHFNVITILLWMKLLDSCFC